MARTVGGRAVVVIAALVCLLAGLAAFVALREEVPAPVDEATTAEAERATVRRERPRRNRVTVLRGAQREAVDEAEAGLAELAAARERLRDPQAPVPSRAPGAGPVVAPPEDAEPDGDRLVVSQHADGTEFRRGWIRGGERDGAAVWYDDAGSLLAEGAYVAGALHGPYVVYSADGTVKRTERWDHGHRVALAEQPR